VHWLRAFSIGLGAALFLALATAGGLVVFERLTQRSAVSAGAPIEVPVAVEQPGEDARTKQLLESWQRSGAGAGASKSQVLDAALDYFARHTQLDEEQLRHKISLLNADQYKAKSTSYCEDAADVRSSNEAWLLDIRADSLYVNGGFVPVGAQSPVDLFFRYTVGLYNLAPELKSYPNGVKSSDGTTAYYEKGLILLGRRILDQVANTSCYLQYRRPLQDAFTADRALDLLARVGFAPSPAYLYPQKPSLELWRAKVAPRLGAAAGDLLEPYLKTDSGEFYRRVGKALGASDSKASEAAADALFRQVFPAS
jgi:hypothetical protein